MQTSAPSTLARGDSIEFQINHPTYPSVDWKLKYVIWLPTPSAFNDGSYPVTVSISFNEEGDTVSTPVNSSLLVVGMQVASAYFPEGTIITEIENPGEAAIIHFSEPVNASGVTTDILFSDMSQAGVISVPSSDTVDLIQGRYAHSYVFTSRQDADVRKTVAAGSICITQNITEERTKSTAELLLIEIDAAIKIIVSAVDAETYVNGQSYTKQDLHKLQQLKERTQMLVSQEASARGEGTGFGKGVKIRTSFKRP